MNAQSPALQDISKEKPAYLSFTLQVSKDPLILLLFFVLVHVFYFPTWNAGFVTDFTGMAERFETHSFWGLFSRFPSLQPVSNFFMLLFYKSFSVNGLPWYLIFTTFHVLNGFLLFRISRRLLRAFQVYQAETIAFVAALLFLISPYASEPVTWRVCFNYLLVTQLILFNLRHTIRWLSTAETRYWIYSALLFFLALFSLELAFVVPFLTAALVLLWSTQYPSKGLLVAWLRHFFLPQFALLAFYFILNKFMLGVWVGHYGAAMHLRFVPQEILGNAFKYFAKYLLFARDWEHSYKTALFTAIDQYAWVFALLFVALGAAYLWFFKKLSPALKLAGWFLIAFFISLLPVINLYFNYLLHIENDRYGYLASMFFFLFIMTLFSQAPRWLGMSVFAIYLSISGYFLFKTNHIWMNATKVYYSLLNDFRWYDKDNVYILNLPDNLEGSLLFRDYAGNHALKDALHYIWKKPFEHNLEEIAQYNMTALSDGVIAEQKSDNQIVVTFNQWGNWWWRKGIGASAYENEHYIFTPNGQFYELQLKNIPANTIFIYQTGGKWEALKK